MDVLLSISIHQYREKLEENLWIKFVLLSVYFHHAFPCEMLLDTEIPPEYLTYSTFILSASSHECSSLWRRTGPAYAASTKDPRRPSPQVRSKRFFNFVKSNHRFLFRLSANLYVSRDARRSVEPPVNVAQQALIGEGAARKPTPGKVFRWD